MNKNNKILQEFCGFEEATFNFYKELKANNNKEWFAENKYRYEKIKVISKILVSEMRDRFSALNLPYYADEKKSLFRINRDIRFSSDKSPYKTNLGIYFLFKPNFMKYNDISMGLYFHIEESECFIAGGLHMPDAQALFNVRTYISDNWEELEQIINDSNFKKHFPQMYEGEKLKKAPKGFDLNHPAIEILKQKDFTPLCPLDKKVALSESIADIILEKGIILQPFMEYIYRGKNQ